MTKKELGEYIKLKREVSALWNRIDKLSAKDVPVVAGKVQASDKDFPWTQFRASVQMYDPKINDEINRTIDILQKRLERCNEQMIVIEEFIDGIEDSELRQIFEMRFVEGMKLQNIADNVNSERSTIGKKITAYISSK